jgi:signal transduction histidine kinase/ActR/RegA family two-component response regulator
MSAAARVLICAPIGRDAALASELLASEGMAATVCDSIQQMCGAMSEDAGALLVGEEALSPSALQLLVDTLDAQPPWSDIPLIVLAGREFSMSGVRPLNVLGPLRNVMILERPVRRLIFTRTVAVALRSRRRQFELRAHLEERAEVLRREQLVNRMKDEFLMTVSHELRTPLNAIYGWARMLATGQIREEQRDRAIEVIERNAFAQTQLVNDLLDVSRAISGKVRLNVQSVDLRQVVVAAVDTVQPAADAKGVRIQTVLDPGAGPVSGDRDRLQQVVWNLLSNAIKFTPRNGRVQVRLERVNSRAEIVVSDTGAGIDRDFLPHVFDRFRQGDAGTTRQSAGLGLGLAIVRHLVELHGGSVAAESDGPGRGATFRIGLPLTIVHHAADDVADHGEPAESDTAPRPARRLDELRVLIVDDEPQARELFAAIVENAGADVRVAASVDEAMAIVRSWSPQVVLSDIEMPGKDGYAFMEGFDDDRRHQTVAIAVTAHSRPEDRLRALEVGFQWHVPKPVEPLELVAVIASLAERVPRTR